LNTPERIIKSLVKTAHSVEEIQEIMGITEEELWKYNDILTDEALPRHVFLKKRIDRLKRAGVLEIDGKIVNRLNSAMRNHIGNMLVGYFSRKYGGISALLGWPVELLYLDFQRKFKDGMSWDNWGEWHIDHIKPKALFSVDEIRECFDMDNLQPLWKSENLKKRDKWEDKN